MRQVFKQALRSLLFVGSFSAVALVNAADTIKVGVLHSLSGTMAISETTLKDTVLMMVDEQNKKGGLLGKKTGSGGGGSCLKLAAFCGKNP